MTAGNKPKPLKSINPANQLEPSISLRIDLHSKGWIGPVKIELLEQIATHGSIAAAARSIPITYKHAWDIVDEMNRLFGRILVQARTGGRHGGGAQITAAVFSVIARFRAIESSASTAAQTHIQALHSDLSAS